MTRINLFALDYWTGEVCTRTGGFDLQFFYPNFIPVSSDYSKTLNSVISSLEAKNSAIISPDFSELLGAEVLNSYIEGNTSCLLILRYGVNAAISSLVLDSVFIANSLGYLIADTINTFVSNLRTLGSYLEQQFLTVYSYSENVIYAKLNHLIIFTSCFCSGLLVIYAVFYYPFFTKEQKKIAEMHNLARILSEY